MDHRSYTSTLENGWQIATILGKLDTKGNWDEYPGDFIPSDVLEKLHYKIMTYFRDFKELPQKGDVIEDEESLTIDSRYINVEKKLITFYFI